jgi:effector-binding domain-containing protein
MSLEKSKFEVEEKELKSVLIASIRYKGKYSDCGKAFGKIGKSFGKYICGKPLDLYYDEEYVENSADIESCMPVRKGKETEEISIRELKGGKCVSLIHKGPYEEIGRTFEQIMSYANEKGIKLKVPGRVVYLKGTGMIFKGNPKNYLTEIQLLINS